MMSTALSANSQDDDIIAIYAQTKVLLPTSNRQTKQKWKSMLWRHRNRVDARKWFKPEFQMLNSQQLDTQADPTKQAEPTGYHGQTQCKTWNAGTGASSRYIRNSKSAWRTYVIKLASGALDHSTTNAQTIAIRPLCDARQVEAQKHIFLCPKRESESNRILHSFAWDFVANSADSRKQTKMRGLLDEWIHSGRRLNQITSR